MFRELPSKYGQRSQERDEAIEEFVAKKGTPPTDNEVAVLLRESRVDKLAEVSTVEVRKRPTARLTPPERRKLDACARRGPRT